MKGTFRISYGFDLMYDEDNPYQAKCEHDKCLIEAWSTSWAAARQNLIKILESMPDNEEISL